VKRTVAPGTLILTDGWPAYASLPDLGYRHRPRTQRTQSRKAESGYVKRRWRRRLGPRPR